VGCVVAAERQHLEQLDQAAPVVVGVGRLQRGLHRSPVHRPLRLVLVHKLAQRLLATTHRREHHVADRVVRRIQSGRGDGEQDVLLPSHLLERVDQFLGDPAVSA